MTKLCNSCKTVKDWSEYFLRPTGRPRALCKVCYTQRRVAHRKKHAERYRQYNRDEKKARSKELSKRAMDRYHTDEVYRTKVRARAYVNSHIRRGKLTRKPCESCGDARSQGHHNDYSKPLEVRWLCAACHTKEHMSHV